MKKRADLFEQAISSVLQRIIDANSVQECSVLADCVRDLHLAENLYFAGDETIVDDDDEDGYKTEFCGD